VGVGVGVADGNPEGDGLGVGVPAGVGVGVGVGVEVIDPPPQADNTKATAREPTTRVVLGALTVFFMAFFLLLHITGCCKSTHAT
jgi:hypothetical protein